MVIHQTVTGSWVPNTGQVIISRSVIFDEGFDTTQKFIVVSDVVQSQPVSSTSAENGCSVPYLHTESGDKQIEIDIEETVKETEPVSEEPVNEEKEPLRRSVRQNKGIPAERYCMSYIARTQLSVEPESWTEMQKLSEHEKLKWIKAADEEIKSLKELQTWQLTELPTGKQAVGCKWVFKIKRDSEGKVHRYKARLVAKGYSQKYGEDYDATFAPVAKQTTFRTVLAIAAAKNMKVKHFDIKTAFLNGDIEEDLYISQPEGYVAEGEAHLVCKLQRSLYGQPEHGTLK